jgi:predicted  nucleic acid-binding Zn-ribbon protein
VKLEESTKRIDELMQERAGFEQNITELQGRLKKQRKTHQGTLNSTPEFVPVVDNFLV